MSAVILPHNLMMAGSSGFVQEFFRGCVYLRRKMQRRPEGGTRALPQTRRWLLRGELLNLDRKSEIRPRIAAPPAVHVPARLQEPDFRALAKVQGGRSQAAVEFLRKHKQRMRAPVGA